MNIFVEKPLSVKPVEEVDRLAKELKKVQDQNGVTIAVGYMLRYSPAVEVRFTSSAAFKRLLSYALYQKLPLRYKNKDRLKIQLEKDAPG